jgi:hypothetical protein
MKNIIVIILIVIIGTFSPVVFNALAVIDIEPKFTAEDTELVSGGEYNYNWYEDLNNRLDRIEAKLDEFNLLIDIIIKAEYSKCPLERAKAKHNLSHDCIDELIEEELYPHHNLGSL